MEILPQKEQFALLHVAYGDTEQMQDVTDISPGGPANPDGPSDMVSEPRWDMMSDE